ncbi:MAG: multiple antibiotic resistance protein [Dehalococcoidales bacterium]|nr:multiple antibiotic resistance protein [Dehalococcoidales bacterium]
MSNIVGFGRDLGLSFIPLFVAVDAIGVLPFMLALTQEMKPAERARIVRYAMLTALGLGLGFIAIGKGILFLLGIEVADFLVAGGLILFILSIRHFTTGKLVELEAGKTKGMVGIVPIGTPLVVGPAVLTTLLLLTGQYPLLPIALAFLLNLVFAWGIFKQANRVARLMREPGLRAASQIASLLLAVIAVMMIRKGIFEIIP